MYIIHKTTTIENGIVGVALSLVLDGKLNIDDRHNLWLITKDNKEYGIILDAGDKDLIAQVNLSR